MPDEICIFMRTFIGPIGSVAPTRRVPYSRLACVWKFPQFTVCCKALALQTGGYCHGTAEIQDRRNNRPVEKKVAAEDQLKRIDIRAPQDGVVHQLAVHTVGGVITAQGDSIMLIVPENEALSIETKVQPQDIDQLRLGQPAVVRFTAFNQRTTPELNGTLSRISADVSEDQKSGTRYYTIRIAIPDSEIVRLAGLKLVPGMPVEAFIQTTPRTMISYLVRPIHDQVIRAFREK